MYIKCRINGSHYHGNHHHGNRSSSLIVETHGGSRSLLTWEQVSFRSSSSVNWGEPDLSEPHTSGTALQDAGCGHILKI